MTAARSRLPYAFSRQAGVVDLGGNGPAQLGLREGPDPSALIEARRVLNMPLTVSRLASGEFDRKLSEAFAGAAIDINAADELGRSDSTDGSRARI